MTKEEFAAVKKQRDLEFRYMLWRFDSWLAGAGTYSQIDAAVSSGRMSPFEPVSESRSLQEMMESGCD